MPQQNEPTTPDWRNEWASLAPKVQKHFTVEIGHLLEDVPPELWKDPDIIGLAYVYLPWHEYSALSFQLRDESPEDIGGWTHHECAGPDGRYVAEESALYLGTYDRVVYHRLLIKAAEALLNVDYARFGRAACDSDGFLNHFFTLQVYDADRTLTFNYCEYVVGRRCEE